MIYKYFLITGNGSTRTAYYDGNVYRSVLTNKIIKPNKEIVIELVPALSDNPLPLELLTFTDNGILNFNLYNNVELQLAFLSKERTTMFRLIHKQCRELGFDYTSEKLLSISHFLISKF